MSSVPKLRFTPEEYLELERKAEYKSEYLDGEIFAMAGARREHNLIVSNVIASLHSQLRGRACETYPSDMRVKVTATGLRTYPDVVVVCGDHANEVWKELQRRQHGGASPSEPGPAVDTLDDEMEELGEIEETGEMDEIVAMGIDR